MKLILLLSGILISLIVFLVYLVSGALFGKDTRANLPKWLSAAATIILGAYFALIEWESFLSAWNKYVVGTEQTAVAAVPSSDGSGSIVDRWEIIDGGRSSNGHTGDIVISASQEGNSLYFSCTLLTANAYMVFPFGDPTHRNFISLFGEGFDKKFDAMFRFADGRIVVLPMFRSPLVSDDPSINLYVPDEIRDQDINRKIDLVLDRIMNDEVDFTFSISSNGLVWSDPRKYVSTGLSRLWEEANRVPSPYGHQDQTSEECRKFQRA